MVSWIFAGGLIGMTGDDVEEESENVCCNVWEVVLVVKAETEQEHSEQLLFYTRYMDDTGIKHELQSLLHTLQEAFQLQITHNIRHLSSISLYPSLHPPVLYPPYSLKTISS